MIQRKVYSSHILRNCKNIGKLPFCPFVAFAIRWKLIQFTQRYDCNSLHPLRFFLHYSSTFHHTSHLCTTCNSFTLQSFALHFTPCITIHLSALQFSSALHSIFLYYNVPLCVLLFELHITLWLSTTSHYA